MKRFYVGIVCIFSVVFVMSFQLVDTTDVFERPPFRRRYVERMDKFHQLMRKKCQDQAMAVARLQVDSVLSGKKLLVEVDSFRLLPRPDKPIKPEFDYQYDSIPVNPLFDRTDSRDIKKD